MDTCLMNSNLIILLKQKDVVFKAMEQTKKMK